MNRIQPKWMLYALVAVACVAVIVTEVKRYPVKAAPEAPAAAEPEEILTPEERSLDGTYCLIGVDEDGKHKDEDRLRQDAWETGIVIDGRKLKLYENSSKPTEGSVQLYTTSS